MSEPIEHEPTRAELLAEVERLTKENNATWDIAVRSAMKHPVGRQTVEFVQRRELQARDAKIAELEARIAAAVGYAGESVYSNGNAVKHYLNGGRGPYRPEDE